MSGEGLTVQERDALLRMCACGHSPNDHGALAGCWLCPEESRECEVTFEDLLIERLTPIVEARSARRESEAAEKALRDLLADIKTHNDGPITPKALRWAATHEALCRSWIFDVLMGLADAADSVAQGREETDK